MDDLDMYEEPEFDAETQERLDSQVRDQQTRLNVNGIVLKHFYSLSFFGAPLSCSKVRGGWLWPLEFQCESISQS